MSEQPSYILKHDVGITLRASDGSERQDVRHAQGTRLPLRRLKAKDLRTVDDAKGPVAAAIAMIARSTGLEIVEVDELDAEDFDALNGLIESFLPPGLPTGATSSET